MIKYWHILFHKTNFEFTYYIIEPYNEHFGYVIATYSATCDKCKYSDVIKYAFPYDTEETIKRRKLSELNISSISLEEAINEAKSYKGD